MQDGSTREMPRASLGDFAERMQREQAERDASDRAAADRDARDRQAADAERARIDADNAARDMQDQQYQQDFEAMRQAGLADTTDPAHRGRAANDRSRERVSQSVRHDPMEMRSRIDRQARNKSERKTARLKALADMYAMGPGIDSAAYLAGLVTGAIFCKLVGKSDKSMDRSLDRDTRRALARARKRHERDAKSPEGDRRLAGIERQVRQGAKDGVTRPGDGKGAAHVASPAEIREAMETLSGKRRPDQASGSDDVDGLVDLYAKAIDMQKAGASFDEARKFVEESCDSAGIDMARTSQHTEEIVRRANEIGRPDVVERSCDPMLMSMGTGNGTHRMMHVTGEQMAGRTLGTESDGHGGWFRRRADGKRGSAIQDIGCRRLLDMGDFSDRFQDLLERYHYGNTIPGPTSESVAEVRDILDDMARPAAQRRVFTGGTDMNAVRRRIFDEHKDQIRARGGQDMSELADALVVAGFEHPSMLGPEGAAERERLLGPDVMDKVGDIARATLLKEDYDRRYAEESRQAAEHGEHVARRPPVVDEASLDQALSREIGAATATNDRDRGLDVRQLDRFMAMPSDADRPGALDADGARLWDASRAALEVTDEALANGVSAMATRTRLVRALEDEADHDKAVTPEGLDRARAEVLAERAGRPVHDGRTRPLADAVPSPAPDDEAGLDDDREIGE